LEKEYQNGVSIVICYYNAGEKIKETLNHIKLQKERSFQNTELILVDNASKDSTNRIIHDVMQDFDLFSWKIVKENKPGLANARICGLKNVSFDLIVYCDDDNWLSADYLFNAEKIMRENEFIGILGGKGDAVSSVEFPFWFDSVQNYYAVGPQMNKAGRVLGERNVVYGAGMVIRTSIFNELLNQGFVFQSLGRTKSNLNAGEDSELCLAVQIMGYHIFYVEDLTFEHFIEPRRLSMDYFNKMKKGISNSGFYTQFYLDFFRAKGLEVVPSNFWLKELIYSLTDIFKSICKFKFNIYRNFYFIRFLLKEKDQYDKNVKHIIAFCKRIKK
jgi:glycosyltransferase involved in cell wall biosynthesis